MGESKKRALRVESKRKNILFELAIFALVICLFSAAVFADDTDNKALNNWPHWRGPTANGVAPTSTAPSKWSETEHIAWKFADPGRGNSTPIIWEGRVYLLTAINTGQKADLPPGAPPPIHTHADVTYENDVKSFNVICLDAKSGKEIWRKVAHEELPFEGHHHRGTYASGSPTTDGERLYVSFGSYGIYCYEFDGTLVWQASIGKLRIRQAFGEGSSPVLDGPRLIICANQEEGSFITALDKKTGKELWRTPHDEVSAWQTPLIVEHAGKRQVVVGGTKHVTAFQPETGKLIWQTAGLGLNSIPSPVSTGGLVFVAGGQQGKVLKAIKLDIEGDLADKPEAMAWHIKQGTPYVPSLLLNKDELYVLDDRGIFSCFEPKTGTPYFGFQRLPGTPNINASPVLADGKIFIATESGDTLVLKAGKTLEVIGKNTLEDTFYASPAVVGGRLFLRGVAKIYCIE